MRVTIYTDQGEEIAGESPDPANLMGADGICWIWLDEETPRQAFVRRKDIRMVVCEGALTSEGAPEAEGQEASASAPRRSKRRAGHALGSGK